MNSIRSIVWTMAAACGLAASAGAQVSIYRWNVPDFDQRRDALPGDGDMHCVPTSAVNWMGYIANHGYAPMMAGPQNWQSQGVYDFVTQNINVMGTLMNTDPSDGTGGAAGESGLKLFLLTHAPYQFTATRWHGNITQFDIALQMLSNGLVNVCYGYYKETPAFPSGVCYVRDGGHCVTLNGIRDAMSTATPTLRIRNPADGSSYFSQSTFSTVTTRIVQESFDSTPLTGGVITRSRCVDFGVGSTTRRYLDSMYVIRSNFNCWAPAAVNPQIHISHAISLFGDPQPQNTTINLSPGAVASAIALHPTLDKAMVVECTQGASAPIYRKKLINLADGSSSDFGLLLPAVSGKTPICFDRFGRLIECDGSVLKVWDLTGRAPSVVGSRTLASPASSICFDDALDEVVVLTPLNRRLIRCSPDLVTAIDEPLPSAVPAMGDGSVVPDPTTGKYLLSIVGGASVHQLGLIPGSPRLALENSLLLPAVQSVQDIQPGDGVFFAMCDGSVKVLDRDPLAGRLRVSPSQEYQNLPPMRAMSLSRSRTNFDPALHSGPAFRNIANPDEGVTPIPDCMADYNFSQSVTVQDVFDFITDWFGGDPHADVNGSASITVQDIFDLLTAWFAGC